MYCESFELRITATCKSEVRHGVQSTDHLQSVTTRVLRSMQCRRQHSDIGRAKKRISEAAPMGRPSLVTLVTNAQPFCLKHFGD